MLRKALLAICLFICAVAVAQTSVVRGYVRDPNGQPIGSAIVQAGIEKARTGSDGSFALVVHGAEEQVRITAAGFAPLLFTYHTGDAPGEWKLSVQSVEQRISVSAEATSRSTVSFSATDLSHHPAISTDEVLRSVPGFTLFRRTPSWSANPTTQGVSLRGAGSTAASRALILLDGVPLNDPFGGWVYWGQVPPETLDSATVIEGGSSEVYGTQAMGGVVELTRAKPSVSHLTATATLGNLFTPGLSVLGDKEWKGLWLGEGISLFRTNGYVPVPPGERGPADTVLNSRNASGWLRAEFDRSPGTRVFAASRIYGEQRQNGTYLQKNSATIRELRAGADWAGSEMGSLSARVYGGTENLTQTFSAVSPDRSTESLTREQSVPINQWGLSALWSSSVGSRQFLMAGIDTGRVEGNSEELGYLSGLANSRLLSGGTQRRAAAFVEDRIRLGSRILLSAALRWDHWGDVDGRTHTIPLGTPGAETLTKYPDHSEDFVSPRVGVGFTASNRILLYASVSRSFRAPTLNELYRGFRVGSVVTLANPALKSERQTGAEAGAAFRFSEKQKVRVAYFWSQIDAPVANVTLSVTPNLITRQRQNLGSLRSPGTELAWEAQWTDRINTTAAYQYVNSKVSSFPPDPFLVNKWLPQVAHHNASVQLRFTRPGAFNCVLGARYQGRQYDDDRNQFALGGYFVADAYVSREIRKNLVLFAGVENVLNRRYEVGRTPTTTSGPPILGRIGIRFLIGEK